MTRSHALGLMLGLAALAVSACGNDTTGDGVDFVCDSACATPPAGMCLDGATLQLFASPGRCVEGACVYAAVETPCALGCDSDAGRCAGDPCADVVCDAPPSGCTVAAGTCQNGVCTYANDDGASCDDGDACTEADVCDDGVCAGTTVRCHTPPGNQCQDGATLSVYDPVGTCVAGVCSYVETEVSCVDGCAADACLGDPCAGVTCDSAPSSCHMAAGTCVDGVCRYDFDDGASCDDADPCTVADACSAGACGGTSVQCNSPPEATCLDADTLSVPASAGSCDAGVCSYATTAVTCGFGCSGIGCDGDPCSGVTCDTPPATTCTDANTLTTYAATGSCGGGSCSYAASTTTCAGGCTSAACIAPARLVINEVRYNTASFPDIDSFLEIAGPPNQALSGVSIVAINGNGGAIYTEIDLSGTLDSAGFYVVAHPGASAGLAAMADLTDARIDIQNGPDSVQLRFGDTVLDALAYGTFGANDTAAGEGTPHPGAAQDQSLTRDDVSTDTDDNAADFTAAGDATPGVATPPYGGGLSAQLACPTRAFVNDVLPFDATGSGDGATGYSFDFGDDSALSNGPSPRREHTFASPGVYVVSVTVSGTGLTDDNTQCAVVVDAEPGYGVDAEEVCFGAGPGPLEVRFLTVLTAADDVVLHARHRGGADASGTFTYRLRTDLSGPSWLDLGMSFALDRLSGEALAAIVIDAGTFNAAVAANDGDAVLQIVGAGADDAASCNTLSLRYRAVPRPDFALGFVGTGTGEVGFHTGETCDGACTLDFDQGTTVTLVATPAADSLFDGWTGACEGQGATANVAMTGALACTVRFEAETPAVDFAGGEQCFSGETWLYDVIDDPAPATTDGLLVIRYKGQSLYSPERGYRFDLEIAPDTWLEVAETFDSNVALKLMTFRIDQGLLNQAMQATGHLRFRHSSLNTANNCTELNLTYNCEACLTCPPGEQDLGLGCKPVSEPYTLLRLDHTWGMCNAYNYRALSWFAVPPASGAGTFEAEYWGCDGARLRVQFDTASGGWEQVAEASGSVSCGWMTYQGAVPASIINDALNPDHTIRVRFEVDDFCAAGVGCGTFNSPQPDNCMRNAILSFPR